MKTTQEKIEQALASSERPDWFYVGAKVFFVLAFVPVVLMISITVGGSDEGLLAAADRLPLYGWTALGLATVSGVLHALHKLRPAKRSNCELSE
jgi:hypothetical protein